MGARHDITDSNDEKEAVEEVREAGSPDPAMPDFFILGLGPSAGGLDSLRRFFDVEMLSDHFPFPATLPLAIALHELSTNAAKYGALSTPEDTGYGMTFLERGIPYEVDGTTDVRFEPQGLRCAIDLPVVRSGGR